MSMFAVVIVGVLVAVLLWDVFQTKHAILRNFPLIGHFRYWLELIGPELRQYIVAANDEERPFNRDERSWVYSSSKQQNNYFGFGTDNDLERSPNTLVIKHSAFPLQELRPGVPGYDGDYHIPCAKVLGEARSRKHAFRPTSIVNVSAMSFGSLSAAAVESINRGCSLAGCLHNTGEGGVSAHHLHGADLIWQIGTGYFGCRKPSGQFDLDRLVDTVSRNPIRAIEIKLSQGAKPGIGGMLPAAKITPEIAEIRGIPMGQDCISPSRHTAFSDVDSMLDFVELLAEQTGLPIGIKSAVGDMEFWQQLATQMASTGRGVDYVVVDGGEGGTGAAPLVFTDHVALPFKLAFVRVYEQFLRRGIQNEVVFVGSGKLGFPETGLLGMAIGCDMLNVAREPMLAIGCIQAQKCHTGRCPTGVATQDPWLMRGLDPADKSARMANYLKALRKEMLAVSRACGVAHPAMMQPKHFEIIDERFGCRSITEVFGIATQPTNWGLPPEDQLRTVAALMGQAPGAALS